VAEDIYQALFAAYSADFQHLASRLKQPSGEDHINTLIIADENTPPIFLQNFTDLKNIDALSNRFNFVSTSENVGLSPAFNDFDFSKIEKKYDFCLYRISKEKLVCHHIFNHVRKILRDEGKLLLIGQKNEGIKSYHKAMTSRLDFSGVLKKNGDHYLAALVKTNRETTDARLDDKEYTQLRKITGHENFSFLSKPGLYGWNKVDKGSEFLITSLLADPLFQKTKNNKRTRVLDLGCGYGYLSLRLLQALKQGILEPFNELCATDNNAAAVNACRAYLEKLSATHDILLNVSADDCGKSLPGKFELIVCNPPFHQGFDIRQELSSKFVKSTHQRLHAEGSAYFVVNVFVALEKLARQHFNDVSMLANNGQFKVLRLRDPTSHSD